ncbi:hypothetical protein Mal64_18100 [Pseudobythopirellula maris]|uniref:Uncharacterized protein n=1 Tax=Pseudobythopirellula maris TaxID=2527991 RepID=A0A5C5ZNB4_9BACT|nr:hypothetical protein [Pseudobythopirellula maris]TWT88331.1 hypothetical protein Mal64_18100 [Pseudobythopirellula maris]
MDEPTKPIDDLRPEYDFERMPSLGRGKHAERYRQGTNVVLPDPDVYKAFPTSDAVNAALRGLIDRGIDTK